MTRRTHYEVRPTPDGRWAVCHQIPGLLHGLSVDVDCPTLESAERECAWLEAERQRETQRDAAERALLNYRPAA